MNCPELSASAVAALFVAAQIGLASPIELVVNGEMEDPVAPLGATKFADSSVPGWSNSSGRVELWQPGNLSSPIIGTDGDPTGQHLELTTDSDAELVSQSFVIPSVSNGFADFSFDGWHRDGTHVNFSIEGTSSGFILVDVLDVTVDPGVLDRWTHYSATGLAVTPGETVTLFFWSTGAPPNGDGGTHIDQVSFVTIPAPPGVLALAAGAGLLASLKRRRAASDC